MPKILRLRTVTAEEERELRRIAKSRTAPICLVQRVKVIVNMLDKPELPACEAGLRAGFSSTAGGTRWVKRFNDEGLAGLDDRSRPRYARLLGIPVGKQESEQTQSNQAAARNCSARRGLMPVSRA